MILPTSKPIFLVLALPFMAAGCSHATYTPLPDALMACNKIIDWSEQQACRQKAQTYSEDWERQRDPAR